MDAPVEDQLHVLGAAHVEVVAQHLFEEDPPLRRSVEYLGPSELGLQNRDVVADAPLPVAGREGCGRRASHLRRRASARAAVDPSASRCIRAGSAQRRDAVVILPHGNHQQVDEELGDDLPRELNIDYVTGIDDLLDLALRPAPTCRARRPRRGGAGPRAGETKRPLRRSSAAVARLALDPGMPLAKSVTHACRRQAGRNPPSTRSP